jgi:hypothetical protein
MATYIPATATASLLRSRLRQAFPGVTFSVRTSKYAGGASIDVYWTDGPTEQQVNPLTSSFRGSDFDGMTDSKTYRTTQAELPDGTVEQVHFGADHVFTHRTMSPEFIDRVARDLQASYYTDRNEQCSTCGTWFQGTGAMSTSGDSGNYARSCCSVVCAAKLSARYLSAQALSV